MGARSALALVLALTALPSCSIAGLFSAPVDVPCTIDSDCAIVSTSDPCLDSVCDPSVHLCALRVRDQDGDGYGDAVCSAYPGAIDCGDLDPLRHPSALERCDGADDDCDSRVDETCAGPDAIASGNGFSCALREGHAYCWGHCEQTGVCGAMPMSDSPVPRAIPGVDDAEALALGDAFACALAQGIVSCWGRGDLGQLGNGRRDEIAPAERVALGRPVVEITAGRDRACAILDDRTVWCWGNNDTMAIPVFASVVAAPVRVESDIDHVALLDQWIAWTRGPRLRCCGGSTEVMLDQAPLQLAWGSAHLCARLATGAVWCLGDGMLGQLGDGAMNHGFETLPVQATIDASVIAAGGPVGCAITPSGETRCWGALDNAPSPAYAPVPLAGDPGLVAISVGHDHVCGIGQDHRVYCSGNNVHHVIDATSDWSVTELRWVRGL
jgi:hypothetical protein